MRRKEGLTASSYPSSPRIGKTFFVATTIARKDRCALALETKAIG